LKKFKKDVHKTTVKIQRDHWCHYQYLSKTPDITYAAWTIYKTYWEGQ
jgi:hypothetical protein